MVLDDEVDVNVNTEASLMPSVVSFLSHFPDYLDIVVQCTRKTEVPSWRTLFAYLPPPQQLFEDSLEKGLLKTAGGYLLVLHTFQELDTSSEQCIKLLQKAREAGDWDLCKELARFLMALDASGDTLREALKRIDLENPGRADGDTIAVPSTSPRSVKAPKQYHLNGKPVGPKDPVIGEGQRSNRQTTAAPNGLGIFEDGFPPGSS